MRPFDDSEKKIIELIGKINLGSNETFPIFLQNHYFTRENKKALLIRHDTKEVIFYMAPEIFVDDNLRAKEFKSFWSLIALVEYLDEIRYIKSIPISTFPLVQFISQSCDDSFNGTGNRININNGGDYLLTNSPGSILDKSGNEILKGVSWNELYDPLSKKLLGIIYPSEGIKYLIENDFLSEEDSRFKKQNKLTWTGIIISFFIGLFSIFFSIYSSCSDADFNEKQFKTIEVIKQNSIDNNKFIPQKLDSISNKLELITKTKK
jgi:hypothetical protein